MLNTSLFKTSFALPADNLSIPSVPLCPSDVPLLLLPVRLETRFFAINSDITELRIRIYPDRIHLDSHEPELTTNERTWGMQYWQQDWAAVDNQTQRADAWRQLADRFGPTRAAWIARVLRPTNAAQRAAATAPVFPTLPPVGPNGEDAWRSAPQARLLPDQWTAILHSGGRAALSVTGKPIPRPLAVGPNPSIAPLDAATEAAVAAGDALAIDPAMQWMVDFEAAEVVGMGLRMRILAPLLNAGLDSLVVFGVAKSLGTKNGSAQFADLLDAHHYTEGLEFLHLGAPTNNTDDRRATGITDDSAHARSFAIEGVQAPAIAANALSVGTALSVPHDRIAATLGNIGGATADAGLDMRSMNAALWQVGWGYYLTNMIGPETGLTAASIDWARTRFLNFVRTAGPFPALRCGPQPYGVLPVTSLDLWTADAHDARAAQGTWLKNLLVNMREKVWRPVAGGVARVGRRSAALADADLADVMKTDAISNSYRTRAVLGRHYLEHLYALNGQDFTSQATIQGPIASRMVQLLGLPLDANHYPRLGHAFFDQPAWLIQAPLVQAGEVSPWRMLEPNYINTLLTTKVINDLVNDRPSNGTSLLQVLLRHSMLRELATAAAQIAAGLPGNNLETLLRDVELVDLVNQPPVNSTFQEPAKTLHWKRQLELVVPAVTGTNTIRQFLEGLTSFTHPTVAALGEFTASLAHLQTLDSETLQLLMQGTLDLSANRLDAWITSYATERLASMTSGATAGQYVGGYGWLENLRPATPPSTIPVNALPPGETGPLVAPVDDSGFIHAPSLTHASAAALLRNAHLGATGVPQADGPFAVDISSRRVREASRLLDGVRQGQPLGALLGYRFERRLHDLKLDRFIAPLRALAPLTVRARETTNAPLEAIAANNVVDGMVLLRRWQDEAPVVQAAIASALGNPSSLDAQTVQLELDALGESVDGLSDAMTAELAYQMVRGNMTRVASTLASVAQGDAPPPELDVARTPRTGNAITHRTLVLFSGQANIGARWEAIASSVRASAEPMLTAWTSKLLGDAQQIRCTVEQVDGNGAVVATQSFPLNELPLTSLDFVYNVDPASGTTSLSYMEQWVVYQSQRRAGGFGSASNLRVQHARPADLAAGEMTLFDALEQARAIRKIFEGARGAFAEDLIAPDQSDPGTLDLTDLQTRVENAEQALKTAHLALVALANAGMNTPAEEFRTAMLKLGTLGVATAIPNIAVGDDPTVRAVLLDQAKAIVVATSARIDQGTTLQAAPVATDPQARYTQLLERARIVFGSKFVLLTNITPSATTATQLTGALAASTSQQGGNPLAVHTWFTRYAHVRDPLARLGTCLRGAEVLNTGDRLSLAVAQLPFDATEQWVGLPKLADKELPMSKLSLVVQSSVPIQTASPISGLFIDEWVEVIPSTHETTALAFQFDLPNSVAPQNILVAVPPVPGQDWTTETLRRVLTETLDLAKLRAVDTSLLGAASQYLPALYVPFNVQDDAVSTNFISLTS